MATFDVVIFGATAFTGRLASLYVVERYPGTFTWAIAGRSQGKLEALKAECGGRPAIIIADSEDPASIRAMVERAKVVVTFAGPFSRYGNDVVAACAALGRDYVDITGESDWVREMIAKHDSTAQSSGARVVHFCGHDSLPWDLMTFMLANKLKEGRATDEDADMATIQLWDHIKGGVSGGTVETAVGIITGKDKTETAPEVRALGFDPLLRIKAGERSPFNVKAKNVSCMECGSARNGFAKPRTMFFMAGVNANCVKRSNAINGYGADVMYREGWQQPNCCTALCTQTALVCGGCCLVCCLRCPCSRGCCRDRCLPKPGTGPSEELQEAGFLHVTGVATALDGSVARARMSFHKDPGYKETSRMAVETGLMLLNTISGRRGGVLTPAACNGKMILERLVASGTTFEFLEEGDSSGSASEESGVGAPLMQEMR